MLPALALAAALSAASPITLYRGASVCPPLRYWDVEDTVIDAAQPDQNFGGEYALSGGAGKVILLRFGDLTRMVARGARVSNARIVLTYSGADKPIFQGISKVQAPWGEGPILTLNKLRAMVPSADPTAKHHEPQTSLGSATWRARRFGMAAWQQPGAADSKPIQGVKASILNDHEIAIEGLAAVVNQMAHRWYDNFGFAITFENSCEFASCQALEGKPRLEFTIEPNGDQPNGGPDLSVTRIERKADGSTFFGHVMNVGDAASSGFEAMWYVNERAGATIQVDKPLAPGEETTVMTTVNIHAEPDHASNPVGLKIVPRGADRFPENDYAEIQATAPTLDIFIQPDLAEQLKAANEAPEDWAQGQLRLFNDTVLAQSKFSFAPEGAGERVNLGAVSIGPEPASSEGLYAGIGRGHYVVGGPPGQWPIERALEAFFRRTISGFFRNEGLYLINFPMNKPIEVKVAGSRLRTSRNSSRFPGLFEWGDTECDGPIASQITLPYQAVFNPIFEGIRPEDTDLLTATMVRLINESIVPGFKPAMLEQLPGTVLIRALDFNNQPLKDTELSLWQSVDGVVNDGAPTFTATTGPEGTVLLATKPGSDGHSNPFGPITDLTTAFLVKATANKRSEWSWLPAWQLFDSASRGNRAASVFDLHFNLPASPVEYATDLALNRIVTDSTNQMPAQLAALVDGDSQTSSTLGGKAGDWVEIDLGRDRPIAEVRLTFPDQTFWKRYDLKAYATGQKPDDASVWSREIDWDWSKSNNVGEGLFSIAYRGPAQRFRFLRIENRVDGPPVKLSKIQVFAAAVPTP